VREAHDITIFEHGDHVSVSLHLKFPPDIGLPQAHEVAESVEKAVRGLPRVNDVRTHLEPLEQPIAADPSVSRGDRRTLELIESVVSEQEGNRARDVRVLPTEKGTVVLMTVQVGSAVSLVEAHQIASRLEETLRLRMPEIADVVVHTEP
jgi:divalent metal cation (Fe/Co/Zn/Cd) transporter